MWYKNGGLNGDWFNLQFGKAITSFGQNFGEIAQGFYTTFDKGIVEPIIDKVFGKGSDFGELTKDVIGNFAFGLLFDDDSIFASEDERGRAISVWQDASKDIDKTIAGWDATIKQPMTWEELGQSGTTADYTEYFLSLIHI